MKIFYHKVYKGGLPEMKVKKLTITEDQVDNLVTMMNSNSKDDVVMALNILTKSNCNQYYDDIIWKLIKCPPPGERLPKWKQLTSNDGINKRIVRFDI